MWFVVFAASTAFAEVTCLNKLFFETISTLHESAQELYIDLLTMRFSSTIPLIKRK